MSGELYQSLASLLRRPMRNWWRNSGVWWLILTGVLLAIYTAATWYEYSLQMQQGYFQWHRRPFELRCLSLTILLPMPIAVASCILVASHVGTLAVQLSESVPVPGNRRVTGASFRLALLHCWPFLLAMLLWSLLFNLPVRYYELTVFSMGRIALHCFELFSEYVLVTIWIVAIAVLPGTWKRLPWFLYAAIVIADFLPVIPGTIDYIDIKNPVWAFLVKPSIEPETASMLMILGALLLYRATFLIASGKTGVGNRLVIYLAGYFMLVNVLVGFEFKYRIGGGGLDGTFGLFHLLCLAINIWVLNLLMDRSKTGLPA